MIQRSSKIMGFVVGFALTLVLVLVFPGAHGHRVIKSFKPGGYRVNSFSKWSSRTQGSEDVGAPVPKFLSRAEAERMYSVRLKQTKHSLQSAATTPAPAQNDTVTASANARVFYVTDYGADPTGATDSTRALSAAVMDAFSLNTKEHMMPGVSDLGGAEIHLQGGNYRLSSPLRMSSGGGGNILIHGGTLRASDDFPKDRYLIELWTSSSQKVNNSLTGAELLAAIQVNNDQSASYEDITMRDLMLDANFRGGGILVIHSLRTNIDNCYISHFMTEGIMVQGGHETYIRNSFLGQRITAGGSQYEKDFSGVAISLMGNDNAVTDVVIFSAAVGIDVTGQANAFIGVHCYNKATGFGGVGMMLRLPGLTQTRIVGCYMDYTGIVAEDPVQLDITNSFFLGDAFITLKSTNQNLVRGVNIVDNMFSGSNNGIAIVQLQGSFNTVEQTVVDRNNARGMALKSTVARATIAGNGTTFTVDFSPVLLFPNLIRHVQYSFYTPAENSFPRHALRKVSNNKVVVEADAPVAATVAVMVDQSATFLQGKAIYS